MKKGISLPITLIGAVVIMLVVFVVLVTAFSGAYSGYWNRFLRVFGISVGPAELRAWQIKCSNYCTQMDGRLSVKSQAREYAYCTHTENTRVEESETGLENDHCYNDGEGDILNYYCEIYLRDGVTKVVITAEDCS